MRSPDHARTPWILGVSLVVLITAAALLSIAVSELASDHTRAAVRVHHDGAAFARSVVNAVDQTVRSNRRAILSGSEPADRSVGMSAALDLLNRHARQIGRIEDARTIERLSKDVVTRAVNIASRRGMVGSTEVLLRELQLELQPLRSALVAAIESYTRQEDQRLARRLDEIDRWIARQQFAVLVITALALGLAGVLGIHVRNQQVTQAERLRAALTQAVEALVSRRHLFAAATHDLERPLQTIRACTSRLLAGPSRPTDSYVAGIQNATAHIEATFASIVDLSRTETGQFPLHVQVCDARLLVDAALQRVAGLAQARGIRVRGAIPPDVELVVDPERMIESISIVLGAALRHGQQGGELGVVLQQSELVVRIVVVGGVPGMLPHSLVDLFDASSSYQTVPASADVVNAMLCERMVAAHRGRIGVEPTHRGIAIWIELPRAVRGS